MLRWGRWLSLMGGVLLIRLSVFGESIGSTGGVVVLPGSRTACSEMDPPFVRFRKEDEYQRRLPGLFADVRHRPKEPALLATDLLVPPEDLGRLYILTRRANWAQEIHFEPLERIRDNCSPDCEM